ncbi:hypothetical protein BLS_006514 [Venturia inaequalis]|uniref:Uncharacterized protein n=1 Tax=Venturia inaequalis TaxID=5025 RepID=A0A8H3UCY5_VENIN|nr:hypothetical protein BLS_006514 [Venturia inaequalis]
MASPNPSPSTRPGSHGSESPRDDIMDLDASAPEEMDVDEATEDQSVSNPSHQRRKSELRMAPDELKRGNKSQKQYHPHGAWTRQASAFHEGRITPAVKARHWEAPSDFNPFFQDLTGKTGLSTAQERINLARYYTVSALVEHDSNDAGPLDWRELSLSARLNVIDGLEEIEGMAPYLGNEKEGVDAREWQEMDKGAANARATLQYLQINLLQPQNWRDYYQQNPRLSGIINPTFTAVPTSTAGPMPPIGAQVEKARKETAGDTVPKYNWDKEELVWCRTYIKDKKDRFVTPNVADTETKIDWTKWTASSDDDKCSGALKQMQRDHHNTFKGRVFPKHTRRGGQNFDPRPSGAKPHRSCLSIWKKLVMGEKKGDLVFLRTLSEINPARHKNAYEKLRAAVVAANTQPGSNFVPATDAEEESPAPESQVVAAESGTGVEQHTTLTYRDRGQTGPGYRATGDEATVSASVPVGLREPASRLGDIDESYDEDMEDEDHTGVGLLPIVRTARPLVPYTSGDEDTDESD